MNLKYLVFAVFNFALGAILHGCLWLTVCRFVTLGMHCSLPYCYFCKFCGAVKKRHIPLFDSCVLIFYDFDCWLEMVFSRFIFFSLYRILRELGKKEKVKAIRLLIYILQIFTSLYFYDLLISSFIIFMFDYFDSFIDLVCLTSSNLSLKYTFTAFYNH